MSYFNDIDDVAHLPLPWDKLENCNILITGASGLIGSCLVEVLMSRSARNYSVYAMGRNFQRMEYLFSRYLQDDGFSILVGDVTEPIKCQQAFHYIIHAASGAAPIDFVQNPVEVMKANILGTINLVEYGISHDLRRFLYVSSGEVYGEGDGRVFTEEYSGYIDTMKPRSCYPSSKRAAETLSVSYAAEYGIDVVIARPCHVYGPHFTENDNRVYAQFIRNVLQDENIVMKSTGQQYRSWVYVVDCVSALFYVLLKGKNGNAYNIADEGANVTIRDLAETIAHLGNKHVVLDVSTENERKGYNVVTKSIYGTDKLRALGWSISGSFESKLNKTIEYKKNEGFSSQHH